MKTFQKFGLLATLAAVSVLAAAVGAGFIDIDTAVAGVLTAEAVTAVELKKLEDAFNAAVEKMNAHVRQSQEIVDKALAEAKKYGDTIEAKTNDKLQSLGEAGNKITADVLEVRNQLLELHQKAATRPAGSGEAAKTLNEIIVASPEWQAASKIPNGRRMDPVTIGSFHRYAHAQSAAAWAQYMNTIIANPNPLTNDQPLVQPQRVGGIITPPEQRLYIRDLIPQGTTTSNLIEFATEASFTNNARPQGDASPVGHGEGERKAESAMTFALSNAPVVTIAHWIPASRQVLSDAAQLEGHIRTRLTYGLKLEEEQEMLTGTGAAGELNGLNNQAAAFTGGATNQTILDTLLKAMLQVSLSNFEVSGFVMHPIDWVNAIMLKDTQNRYLFANPQDMVAPRVWAKPVVATQSQTLNRFLAGAFSLGAQIWDKEDANVRISGDMEDYFVRNLVAILAEERLALTVYRPSAFVYGPTGFAG